MAGGRDLHHDEGAANRDEPLRRFSVRCLRSCYATPSRADEARRQRRAHGRAASGEARGAAAVDRRSARYVREAAARARGLPDQLTALRAAPPVARFNLLEDLLADAPPRCRRRTMYA